MAFMPFIHAVPLMPSSLIPLMPSPTVPKFVEFSNNQNTFHIQTFSTIPNNLIISSISQFHNSQNSKYFQLNTNVADMWKMLNLQYEFKLISIKEFARNYVDIYVNKINTLNKSKTSIIRIYYFQCNVSNARISPPLLQTAIRNNAFRAVTQTSLLQEQYEKIMFISFALKSMSNSVHPRNFHCPIQEIPYATGVIEFPTIGPPLTYFIYQKKNIPLAFAVRILKDIIFIFQLLNEKYDGALYASNASSFSVQCTSFFYLISKHQKIPRSIHMVLNNIDEITISGIAPPPTTHEKMTAPEILLQYAPFGRKTEAWNIGCILLEILIGYNPFADSSQEKKIYIISKLLSGIPQYIFEKVPLEIKELYFEENSVQLRFNQKDVVKVLPIHMKQHNRKIELLYDLLRNLLTWNPEARFDIPAIHDFMKTHDLIDQFPFNCLTHGIGHHKLLLNNLFDYCTHNTLNQDPRNPDILFVNALTL